MSFLSDIYVRIERRLSRAAWSDDVQRRQAIIKMAAPVLLCANRAVTPYMISRFVNETAGLSAYETGRKLSELVKVELARDLVAG